MKNGFEENLVELSGAKVEILETESESVRIIVSGGAKIYAGYWRLLKEGRSYVSSFDHGLQYGLSSPINATEMLAKVIQGQLVRAVKLIKESGDLELIFENNCKLQVFNFTGNEAWEVEFADGTNQLSNYL